METPSHVLKSTLGFCLKLPFLSILTQSLRTGQGPSSSFTADPSPGGTTTAMNASAVRGSTRSKAQNAMGSSAHLACSHFITPGSSGHVRAGRVTALWRGSQLVSISCARSAQDFYATILCLSNHRSENVENAFCSLPSPVFLSASHPVPPFDCLLCQLTHFSVSVII